jgi:hypothetical protein
MIIPVQHYLQLPLPCLKRPFTVLPRPNAIDIWLDWNCDDAYQGVLILGYLHISDVPREQVLCTVHLATTEVIFYNYVDHHHIN